MELSFGQPLGSVVQYAYVVQSIDRAAADYVDRLGIGPWFVRGPFTPSAGRYRGQPTSAAITLARAFSGHVMLELVEQHDDTPSVFHPSSGQRRYGFHHWAVFTEQIDADIEGYRALGYEEAYSDVLPSGSRISYVDSRRDLPGMIELVEHTDAQEQVYDTIYRASVGWGGDEPLRCSEI
jgi:hypothetical protein